MAPEIFSQYFFSTASWKLGEPFYLQNVGLNLMQKGQLRMLHVFAQFIQKQTKYIPLTTLTN